MKKQSWVAEFTGTLQWDNLENIKNINSTVVRRQIPIIEKLKSDPENHKYHPLVYHKCKITDVVDRALGAEIVRQYYTSPEEQWSDGVVAWIPIHEDIFIFDQDGEIIGTEVSRLRACRGSKIRLMIRGETFLIEFKKNFKEHVDITPIYESKLLKPIWKKLLTGKKQWDFQRTPEYTKIVRNMKKEV